MWFMFNKVFFMFSWAVYISGLFLKIILLKVYMTFLDKLLLINNQILNIYNIKYDFDK